MSQSGWYPDPDGTTGRFRYWDGEAWSVATTSDPARTAAPGGSAPPSRDPHNRGWLIALIVLALVTILVIVTVLVTTGGTPFRGRATEDTNSATPTVSAWDETSTPTPPPLPTFGQGQLVACPSRFHAADTPQAPGRLTASRLSVAMVPGWTREPYAWTFPFTYDMQAQSEFIIPDVWLADVSVSRLAKADWPGDIADTAIQIAECIATSQYYTSLIDAVPLTSEPMDISGHAAWAVTSNVLVSDPPGVGGDRVTVIVVDLGGDLDHYGLFSAACTINEPIGLGSCADIDAVMPTLAVSG